MQPSCCPAVMDWGGKSTTALSAVNEPGILDRTPPSRFIGCAAVAETHGSRPAKRLLRRRFMFGRWCSMARGVGARRMYHVPEDQT